MNRWQHICCWFSQAFINDAIKLIFPSSNPLRFHSQFHMQALISTTLLFAMGLKSDASNFNITYVFLKFHLWYHWKLKLNHFCGWIINQSLMYSSLSKLVFMESYIHHKNVSEQPHHRNSIVNFKMEIQRAKPPGDMLSWW